MTKRFKLKEDLTCPELAGYKLPEIIGRPVAIEVEMEYIHTPIMRGSFPATNPDGTVKARWVYE